jgi:hypothetical protein
MTKSLARRATLLGWFDHSNSNLAEDPSSVCVAIRLPDDGYTVHPAVIDPSLAKAIKRLDETAVVALSSRVTARTIATIAPGQKSFVVESTSARIPVIPTLDDVDVNLTHYSRACIVLDEKIVLVWSHDATGLLNVAHDVEVQLGGQVSPYLSIYSRQRRRISDQPALKEP